MVLTNQKRNFRSVKTLFETEMQAEQNLPKAYNFEMHRDAFDWWFSSISIKGYYLNTKDKKLAFDELGERIAQKAKAVVLIGQTAEKIAAAVRKYHKSKVKIEFADSQGRRIP